jgi:hypothetical protein
MMEMAVPKMIFAPTIIAHPAPRSIVMTMMPALPTIAVPLQDALTLPLIAMTTTSAPLILAYPVAPIRALPIAFPAGMLIATIMMPVLKTAAIRAPAQTPQFLIAPARMSIVMMEMFVLLTFAKMEFASLLLL